MDSPYQEASRDNWSKGIFNPVIYERVLFSNAVFFLWAGNLFTRYSSLKASFFRRLFLTATISTGSLALVYFEAFPWLCFKRRSSMSLVTPQYKELSAHFNK